MEIVMHLSQNEKAPVFQQPGEAALVLDPQRLPRERERVNAVR